MPIGLVSRLARPGALAALGFLLLSPAPSEAADTRPSEVKAAYDVNFNGINIGTYEFASTESGHSYKLTGNAKVSLLLGALTWTGATEASGQLAGDRARPARYGFEYQAQSRTGSTRMSFTDDTVTQVLQSPPPRTKEGLVPVLPHHLKGVLDPLTAVLAISRGSPDNPCTRRIPIYDGTQRFDILLQPKGQVALEEPRPNGQAVSGFVCRVRYVPIAGYRPDDGTRYLAENNNIEIVLRPLPGANLFVPQSITIPTIAGNATFVARRVNVVSNGQIQIALSN